MWTKKIRFETTASADLVENWDDPREPDLVLLFGATERLRDGVLAHRLTKRFPKAFHFGCSSGTMVEGQALSDEGVVALAIGFERTRLAMAMHQLDGPASSRAAGIGIGRSLAAPDLAGVFVLSDGLGVNGSQLVAGLVEALGSGVAISGGLAGDGAAFATTLVTIAGATSTGVVAAVGFYGSSIRIAHGSAGGWDEFGPARRITHASGNVLYELDGKPALDLYERYLGDEANDLPASALLYPLKVWRPDLPEDEVVRTVLSVDRARRTMTFAGDVPEGWSARLMRGSFERLSEGAALAASHARESMAELGATPELCLFVSCVGRRLLMGQRTEEEAAAVAAALGNTTPTVGFYSYGEISPNNQSGACGLHNQTVTLTLIAEAA